MIVVGNETHGVSDEVGQQCNHRLTIPMMNGADSLNVAIATGIFCHTFRQQHPAAKVARTGPFGIGLRAFVRGQITFAFPGWSSGFTLKAAAWK